ncbi:Aspartyl/glutamyl-tRNA(Asn/Gln) amidotransferase subunit B [Rickettsiales endosymbiont of Paramecium tredecaurelia]|uniref:Asp-tRNA(Asn)/Glu-tRNA(Gln) amidotransferase subunit GatB n=1 Tax=Candidatus Sarmatiella mevalonica TaxID=2770581 RepID=UPI0019222168|nr:Asp-tRNA(Asn)/Glu-tRNA(Gln) amidotransferase subunit GatB [Candidatus Sarmatiella mevalonica]MBL3284893.1 Aspartyl/glutamyl-tRNA(Asn/Gln) amidotransferase subunit B [Candidatus Sarmatiella mevalonica]
MEELLKKWECVIGLEIHAQISSKSKLFSSSSTTFGAEPNENVSFVDAAMPGMLPVLNKECLHQAIRTALALNSRVHLVSMFDRKNYFYADLPQGYQISQFYHPIATGGYIKLEQEDGEKTIRINRLHIEQDAGKNIHDQSPKYSFVDLNRVGVGLMEIVSEPDLRCAQDVLEYVKALRSILRYIGSCDGDMEKGSLRCDVNISVRPRGSTELGTRCEIKNVNSMRSISRAIEFEFMRQVELIQAGGKVEQETRLFDATLNETRAMRSKEDAHDYRYFPDPDLLPVVITQDLVEQIGATLPELPNQKRKRYIGVLGLSAYDAQVIAEDAEIAEYFERAVDAFTQFVHPSAASSSPATSEPSKASSSDSKIIANWITSELFALLGKNNVEINACKARPEAIAKLVYLIDVGTISGKIAKDVLVILFDTGMDPEEIVLQNGWKQVQDVSSIEAVIDKVLQQNAPSVEQYLAGKDKLFGFFVGSVMKETKGLASPSLVNDLLKQKLTSYNKS